MRTIKIFNNVGSVLRPSNQLEKIEFQKYKHTHANSQVSSFYGPVV